MTELTELPKVYLETSFISYLAADLSAYPVTTGRQLLARHWWEHCRDQYALYTSEIVREECTKGDPDLASRRVLYLANTVELPAHPQIEALGRALLIPDGPIPLKAIADAFHVATAAFHRCDYLLTLNLTHIANAVIIQRTDNIIRSLGYVPAFICTPDQLGAEPAP